MLHRRRRARALDRLRRTSPAVPRVVFVCYGNICRSPFAARGFEATLSELDVDPVEVVSTGFYAEEGRSSPPEAVAAARRRGVDLSGHRSTSLDPGTGGGVGVEASLVFVMEPGQRGRLTRVAEGRPALVLNLGDLDPEPIRSRGIRDPYGQPPEVFDEVFNRIERCVEVAARSLAEARS